MILDTSAMVAILYREPEADAFVQLVHDADACRISVGMSGSGFSGTGSCAEQAPQNMTATQRQNQRFMNFLYRIGP